MPDVTWRSPTRPFPHQLEFKRWRRGLVDGVVHPAALGELPLGSGKTLTAIEETLELLTKRPSAQTLVLAMNANVETVWGEQIPQHAPGLPFVLLNCSRRQRAQLLDADAQAAKEGRPIPPRIWVHSHEDLPAFGSTLAQYHWDFIIIDECAKFRTASAKRVALLTGANGLARAKDGMLRSDFKLALSGLPMIKSAIDLYPILKWLGVWKGNKTQFIEAFVYVDEYNQQVGLKDEDGLKALLALCRFQVPRSAVINIPRSWRHDRVDLPEWQMASYKRIQKELKTRYVDENGVVHESELRSRLSELLRLHQVAAGFEAIDAERFNWRDDNAKTRHLINNVVPELADEKFIVWTAFKPEAENLTRLIRKAGLHAVSYYGRGPDRDMENERSYASWKKGEAQVFISTLAKGSTGLNLPEASAMVYHTRTYNTEHFGQSLERNARVTTKHAQLRVVTIEGNKTLDPVISAALGEDFERAAQLTSVDLKAVLG